MMAEVMRKELVKRSSYDNVITKYLDEMDLMIQEENRKRVKSDSVGEIMDEGLENAFKFFEKALEKVKPNAPIHPMIQTSYALGKFLNNEEFTQPEQVFSIKFPGASYKFYLLGLYSHPEGTEAFTNLVYLQYAKAREHLLELFLAKGKPWLKDRLLLSLLYPQSVQSTLYPSQGYESHLSGSNVFKNLS